MKAGVRSAPVQWVLLAAVALGIGILEFGNLKDRARLAAVRRAARHEAVRFRTPVSAQWSRGRWGRGKAKGMQLVVRDRSFELSYPFPTWGLLGTEWYCRGSDARIEVGQGRFLPPKVNRTCVVLSIPSIDRPDARQVILLASPPPSHVLRSAWDALIDSGVAATGTPPDANV